MALAAFAATAGVFLFVFMVVTTVIDAVHARRRLR